MSQPEHGRARRPSDFVATHTGVIVERTIGKSHRNMSARVELRETKMFFITRSGDKFRKTRGTRPGDEWLDRMLQVDSVKAVGDE